jgi:hypothetical protein
MDNDLERIQANKTTALYGLVGYIVIYISAVLTELDYRSVNPNEKKLYTKSAEQATALGSLLLLISLIIRGKNATISLSEKQQKQAQGEKVDSIVPDTYIASGFVVGIIGNILRLIGNVMNLSE